MREATAHARRAQHMRLETQRIFSDATPHQTSIDAAGTHPEKVRACLPRVALDRVLTGTSRFKLDKETDHL